MARTPKMTVIEGGVGVLAEPDWSLFFDDELDQRAARETWASVIAEMRKSSILSSVNVHAIQRLCQFKVVYELAARHIAVEGPILKRARAKVGVWSPWWSVMRQADEVLRALENELGISPTSRKKASPAPVAKPRPLVAADEFLDPKRWAEAHPKRGR